MTALLVPEVKASISSVRSVSVAKVSTYQAPHPTAFPTSHPTDAPHSPRGAEEINDDMVLAIGIAGGVFVLLICKSY